MALPNTIASEVGRPGHHPPIKTSGGSFYALIRNPTSNHFAIYKADSDDPSSSWTEQDGGNRPGSTFVLAAWVLDGDIIHIAAVGGGVNPPYDYFQFDTSTDLWVTGAGSEIDALTSQPDNHWISIAVRSDGDVVVVYAGQTDGSMGDQKERVDVNVRSGSPPTWSGPTALDAGGDVHYGNPNCVLGTNDFVHCLWQFTIDTTADPPDDWANAQGRSVDPADDSLSTTDGDAGADTDDALLGKSNAVSYDDAGTQRIVAAGVSEGISFTFRIFSIATEDGSDHISFGTPVFDTTDADPRVFGDYGIITIAEVSGDLHVLFSGGGVKGVTADLWYTTSTDDGATWTTPTEEIDGITVNFISANIYVRGLDTVMAYVYDDGGVQKYNEKVLPEGGAAALLPLLEQKQNTLLRM